MTTKVDSDCNIHNNIISIISIILHSYHIRKAMRLLDWEKYEDLHEFVNGDIIIDWNITKHKSTYSFHATLY